jgi:hypothetical protein
MVPTSEPPRDYRTLVALALAVLVVLFAFFGRGGWYFSVQVGCDTLDATDQPNTNELRATAAGSDAVPIEGTAEDPLPDVLRTDAVYSVWPADGAVVLTDVTEEGRQLGVLAVVGMTGKQLWVLTPGSLPGAGRRDLRHSRRPVPRDLGGTDRHRTGLR